MTFAATLKAAPWMGLVAVLLFLGVTRLQLSDAQGEVRRSKACAAAIKGEPAKGAKFVDSPEFVCPAEIADADRQARQLRACEQALKTNVMTIETDQVVTTNGAGVELRCPSQTVALFRRSMSDAVEILSLRGTLKAAENDRNQAVARAEQRGRQLAERDLRAQAVRQSAPRDGDGLRIYDADRLRERWEASP